MEQFPRKHSSWSGPKEPRIRGAFNRVLQLLARIAPGEQSVRALLHRARGVKIGKGVKIGYDVVLENARPDLITIADGVFIGMRVTIIAHFKEFRGVRIERDAFIGPGSIILPKVTIGAGAVVMAGTVVSQSVPPFTIVQGNPAVPIARCEIPLGRDISLKAFSRAIKPLAIDAIEEEHNTFVETSEK
jgi:acetyltransferase-like isoleucine patch superfamily enzyme